LGSMMRGLRDRQVLMVAARADKPAVTTIGLLAACWLAAAPAFGLELQLPIDCTPGKGCFVQNHPDVDPGGEPRDFTCGDATFAGLTGTDIRLLSVEAAKGVKVLAAAAGVVRGARDDMADHLMRTDADKIAIAGRECGNGVVITHGEGWETQYCQMRLGSVRVHRGDKIAAGAWLGDVGQSGETTFAHIHITVRHGGRTVDPFLGQPVSGICHADGKTDPAASLWRKDVEEALGPPVTRLLEAGFSGGQVNENALEDGHSGVPPLVRTSLELVLFARIMHLAKGDRVRLRAELPLGPPIDLTAQPVDHDKAMMVVAISRSRGQTD